MTCFWKSIFPSVLLLMGLRGYKLHNFILIQVNSFLPPPSIRVSISFLKIGQKGGQEKLLRNRGLVGRMGVFLERGVSKLFHQFSLLLEFLSGKYSHLLYSIDLFFHVVYFLLENGIIWNLFFFLTLVFKYNFVKILLLMTFISISISLKTSNILENKSQVFERSDCTITVHDDLYYNELKI